MEDDDDLVSIGQFARRSGLAVSAVRFYADTGVLTPAEIDAASGYRRYRSSQIADAVQIRQLRQLDLPLAEVRRLLALPTAERVRALRDWRNRFAQTTVAMIAAVDDFITEMHEGDPMTTTVIARDWYQALRQVVPAANPGDRPTLASVLVERRPDALRLVATDSLRLCLRDVVPVSGDSREEPVASVPAVAARGELAAALLSFGPVAAVAVTVAGDDIKLSFPNEPAAVTVSCDYSGEPVSFGVQPRFVVDALQAMTGPDVAIDTSGPTSPIRLRSANDGSVMTLVMPVLLTARA